MRELGSCTAVIHKLQTTADGGARITLDVGSDSKRLIKNLLDKKLSSNDAVVVAFVDDYTGNAYNDGYVDIGVANE